MNQNWFHQLLVANVDMSASFWCPLVYLYVSFRLRKTNLECLSRSHEVCRAWIRLRVIFCNNVNPLLVLKPKMASSSPHARAGRVERVIWRCRSGKASTSRAFRQHQRTSPGEQLTTWKQFEERIRYSPLFARYAYTWLELSKSLIRTSYKNNRV